MADVAGNGEAGVADDVEASALNSGHGGSLEVLGGGASSDVTAPSIININPAPNASISRTQTITFSVVDPEAAQVVVAVIGVIYPDGTAEWVYDGNTFFSPFSASSVVTPRIDGGFDFSITRTGGWPDIPTFRCRSVDAEGNV